MIKIKLDKTTFKNDFKKKLISMFAEDIETSSPLHQHFALSSLIKDYCSDKWLTTNKKYKQNKTKQVYYFSMEFLIGRLLESNLLNLGIKNMCEESLTELGINLLDLEELEPDAGLGNGGLGRLAACFLDSMATLSIPGNGCGIRYKYGLFEQKIINGYQVEIPDNWLKNGNSWEVRKENKSVEVKFGGDVSLIQQDGRLKVIHNNYESILAVPYDTPVIGYNNTTVNTLRLWSSESPDKEFDFLSFNHGDYLKAVESKYATESISQILYPDDTYDKGKILRLKQEYFFVSAGIQSIIRSYKKLNLPINRLHEHVAIHINDTHPSVAVAELMRILVDEEGLCWEESFEITNKTLAYTNHTIMSEALEKWPINMFKPLLPRIYMIIEEINKRFCNDLIHKYNVEWPVIREMSIIQDGYIQMAYLALVGCHSINGVAKLHTEILQNQLLNNFYSIFPEKFSNKTNGITHRRWLLQSNPSLSALINETIGDQWIYNPNLLINLKYYAKDKSFQNKISEVKTRNKISFSNFLSKNHGISVDPYSMFDIQVKRIHAYKRQVLNILHIMDLYNKLKENPNLDIVPRTFFFGAKASPGYYLAKEVIKLINSVANKISLDKSISDKINVIFLENYRVSLAQKIIPCADVSEQISTASKEASGTSNMKFMMNGAITIATLDGANIEIKEAVGEDNIILFGLTSNQVLDYYKNKNYSSLEIYISNLRLNKILHQIMDGFLNLPSSEFTNVYNNLVTNNDEFFVLKDFDSYSDAHKKIDSLYRDKTKWQEMCITNIAHSGIFSSDNTIKQYYDDIWLSKI